MRSSCGRKAVILCRTELKLAEGDDQSGIDAGPRPLTITNRLYFSLPQA